MRTRGGTSNVHGQRRRLRSRRSDNEEEYEEEEGEADCTTGLEDVEEE